MCKKKNNKKTERQATCFVIGSSLCKAAEIQQERAPFFAFLICQDSPAGLRSPEWHLAVHSRAPVLLARSGHSLGTMMKRSAGGTARCGKWSKRPRCRWSSGRSGSASLMDGPPSLPGILSLFWFFSLISLLLLGLKLWLNLHNYLRMHTKAHTGIKVRFCWNRESKWGRSVFCGCTCLLFTITYCFKSLNAQI